MPAQRRRLAGFDQYVRAEIDAAGHMRENADHRDHGRAQKADDHDLQMGGAVGAIHRMVHNVLPFLH